MGRWVGVWLGLGQHHSRDKASAYANWGKSLLSSQFWPWPGHATLTSLPLLTFSAFPLSLSPFSPPSLPFLTQSTQEEETSHSCAHSFFILNELVGEPNRALCDLKKAIGACPHSHLNLPLSVLPCLLSSSWVHVVIKEDCWCVINLFKKKRQTRNLVPTETYFNFILLFSSC